MKRRLVVGRIAVGFQVERLDGTLRQLMSDLLLTSFDISVDRLSVVLSVCGVGLALRLQWWYQPAVGLTFDFFRWSLSTGLAVTVKEEHRDSVTAHRMNPSR